jgi:hypothetical protein
MTTRPILSLIVGCVCFMSFACSKTPPETSNSSANSNTAATPVATARTLKALTTFNVEWLSQQIPAEMQAGKPTELTLTLKNPTSETWPAGTGPVTVNIAYHWVTADGKPVVFEGVRTRLPHDIAPGESITLNNVGVLAPPNPGTYRLQVTLVQETIAWLEWKGGKPLTVPVTVR